MLHFRTPELSDKAAVDQCLADPLAEGCDFSFGNLFLWRTKYNMKFCIEDGFLFMSSALGRSRAFSCPVGQGNFGAAVEKVVEYAESHGIHPVFYSVTEKQRAAFEKLFPGRFSFCKEEDYFDYIYLTEKLAELKGKKYHGKRNHIAKFEKVHEWKFKQITRDNLPDCKYILSLWYADKSPDGADAELEAEALAAEEAITFFEELGYEGGIVYADGKPAAYAMGEGVNGGVFCTHIEKASPEFRESYALVNRETAKLLLGRYQYINREDDAGDEGLRKAKLSYHPEILLIKYAVSEHTNE